MSTTRKVKKPLKPRSPFYDTPRMAFLKVGKGQIHKLR